MPISSDLYVHQRSWLHEVDPRVKFLFVICGLVLLLVYNNVYFMGFSLLCLHGLYWSVKIPSRRIQFIWSTLLPVSSLMFLLWVVFYPTGTPLLQIWFIKITASGLAQGGVLGLRILCMAFVVFACLYTTGQSELVRALEKLKVPYEWGLILSLTLRYIPFFQETYQTISQAQQARGLDPSKTTGFRRVKQLMPIFISLIISAFRTGDQLSKALEARAFGNTGIKRTYYLELHLQFIDYLLFGVIITGTLLLMYFRFTFLIGADPLVLIP